MREEIAVWPDLFDEQVAFELLEQAFLAGPKIAHQLGRVTHVPFVPRIDQRRAPTKAHRQPSAGKTARPIGRCAEPFALVIQSPPAIQQIDGDFPRGVQIGERRVDAQFLGGRPRPLPNRNVAALVRRTFVTVVHGSVGASRCGHQRDRRSDCRFTQEFPPRTSIRPNRSQRILPVHRRLLPSMVPSHADRGLIQGVNHDCTSRRW